MRFEYKLELKSEAVCKNSTKPYIILVTLKGKFHEYVHIHAADVNPLIKEFGSVEAIPVRKVIKLLLLNTF